MIFWIENEIETSYDKFIEDLNNNTYDHNLDGYTYYFRFIKKLTGNNKYRNIDDLITYLNDNAFRLNFKLNTSGTTSMPKKVDVNLEKCIRQALSFFASPAKTATASAFIRHALSFSDSALSTAV